METAARPARGRRCAVLLVAGDPARVPERMDDLGVALEKSLPAGWSVFTVARTEPSSMAEAIHAIADGGAEELVVVPLHPQYIPTVTGPILRDLYAALRRDALHVGLTVRTTWYDDAAYVHALARDVADRVAHGDADPAAAYLRFEMPRVAPADEGETGPWHRQTRRTAELVVERLGWCADRWLLKTEVERPANAGRVVTCPLPFPEGLVRAGGEARARLVEVLRGIVVNGPQPAAGAARTPLLAPADRGAVMSDGPLLFLMIGASLGNGIGSGRGPALRYSDPRAFATVKRSRKALRTALDHAREHTPLVEAFVWNTCQRIELYGWLPAAAGVDRGDLVASLRHALFGAEPDGLAVNVLEDREAWHHLARTACGLNSALPGDRDVTAQLQTAARIAQCTKTGGARMAALVDAAVALAHDIHGQTCWGRFSTGYCAAAITRICEVDSVQLDRFQHVVIGGSTTSRSVLTTLATEHGVPHRHMTLVYRDHHGQLRQLRAALGSGRKLRVHDYGEEAVLRAIGNADFVYFGIDQAEPVLDAAALLSVRDLAARRLTVVDFNEFGSIRYPDRLAPITRWSARELDEAVAANAAVTLTRSGFTRALAEAEEAILARLGVAPVIMGGVRVFEE